jgi:hypothetical protein
MEGWIGGYNGDPLGQRLSDNLAVEGIAMVKRHLEQKEGMIRRVR